MLDRIEFRAMGWLLYQSDVRSHRPRVNQLWAPL